MGKPVSRGFTQAHLDLLKSLARVDGTTRVSDYREELIRGLQLSDLPFDRSVLARGLDMLDCDLPLPSFVEHRDFAPWNLKWLRKDVLGLLDWEWGEPEGLPWQDACRHFYIEDVHFGGSGQVWQALLSNEILLRYRREFDIPAEALAGSHHAVPSSRAVDGVGGCERAPGKICLQSDFGTDRSYFSSQGMIFLISASLECRVSFLPNSATEARP